MIDENGGPLRDEGDKPIIKHKADSDETVLRRVGVAPVGVELMVRRLRMCRRWLISPGTHAQEVGSVFGQLPVDPGPTALSNGCLSSEANVYALGFVADVVE
eukprot:8938924-Pyramimonas_sp.AAC.1